MLANVEVNYKWKHSVKEQHTIINNLQYLLLIFMMIESLSTLKR